jgi:hypothetical protein
LKVTEKLGRSIQSDGQPELKIRTLQKDRLPPEGGSRNDIRLCIFDEDALANWRNRRTARMYYDSGKVTAGKIDVRLKPGTHHLVFDNSFSGLSNKAITSDIQIQVEKCVISEITFSPSRPRSIMPRNKNGTRKIFI